MLDKQIEISPQIYQKISTLLETGKVADDNFELDMSPVQNISIKEGSLVFDPPIKLKLSYAGVTVSTTVTTVKNKRKGIEINIDNSPIDVKVVPNG